MKITKLTTKEQFEKLKRWDLIIVEWSDYSIKHHDDMKRIMTYRIYENKTRLEEIICKLKNNHYFNYDLYLKGQSHALDVYKIEE